MTTDNALTLKAVAALLVIGDKILVQPDVKAKLLEAGADVTPISVEQFAEFMKAESEKFLQIIKQAGLKPE